MKPKKNRKARGLVVTLAVVLAGGLLAACGGSSSSGTTGTTSGSQVSAGTNGPSSAARGKLRACLQQHGITLPPRRQGATGPQGPTGQQGGPPSGGGRGFFGGAAANPKLRAAMQACGGSRFGQGSRLGHGRIQQFVTCVRQHGYNMPNPSFNGGPTFPSSIRNDPKFQAAAKSCQSLLVRPGGYNNGGPGGMSGPGGPPGAPGPGAPSTASS